MKFLHFIALSFVFLMACQQSQKNTPPNENIGETPAKVIDAEKKYCFTEKDSTNVKIFVSDLIKDISSRNFESIINKLEYPEKEREYIKEMSEEFPNYFQAVFTNKIYDEEDNLVGYLKGLEDAEIIYEKTGNDCYDITIGLKTGLYFNLKKQENKIIISEHEVAG